MSVDIIYELKNIDDELVAELNRLNSDFWDFKNINPRNSIHGIHSYPAVMIYPISRNIIEIIQKYQNPKVLLDPFMGSGTVLVEGVISGLEEVYGADLNPLAQFISKVKTVCIPHSYLEKNMEHLKTSLCKKYEEMEYFLIDIYNYIEENGLDITSSRYKKDDWGNNAIEILSEYFKINNKEISFCKFEGIGFWFVPNAIIELQIIKDEIMKTTDKDIRNFFLIAFSETIRIVSNRRNGEFKMYRMPVSKIKEYRPNVKEKFLEILNKNCKLMNELYYKYSSKFDESIVHILNEDARILKSVPDNTIDLVITSPPYGDSKTTVAYGEFSKLSLQWLDLEMSDKSKISSIDRNLMGGTKFKNGFELDINSKVLKNSLEKIMKENINLERAGDVYSFYKDLEQSIKIISQKCRKNSYQFWVVGNRTVKGEKLQTDEIIIEIASKYGLKHIYTCARNISNKVMPKLNSPTNETGKKVATMSNEHIVILRKE